MAITTARTARPKPVPAITQRRPCCTRSSAGPITGATIENGAIVISRYRNTLPRCASDGAEKNTVPASATVTIASAA